MFLTFGRIDVYSIEPLLLKFLLPFLKTMVCFWLFLLDSNNKTFLERDKELLLNGSEQDNRKRFLRLPA